MFTRGSFGKECAEAIIVGRRGAFHQATVRAETVLDGIQLPAGIANLDTSLTNVHGDDFTHFERTTRGKS
jgi:hypothetical protein